METYPAPNNFNSDPEEKFSLGGIIEHWKNNIVYTLNYHWRFILLSAVIGGMLGLGYALIRHITYTAKITFIVEESKSSSGGGSIASALAGQVGIDLGSISGSNGMLAGDNVLELIKSKNLIKKTLLTPSTDTTKSIADSYAEAYNWKERWRKNNEIGEVKFEIGRTKFTRLQDSLLQTIINRIVESELSIVKPDKKLGFFQLQITNRNELLSKLISERLLKITTDFYVETKTKRQTANVNRLQYRADSLELLLNRKSYSAGAANQLLLDANPAYSSSTVDAEIVSRNKYIQSTVYAEIVKNLEVSKTSLLQETPTFQIVESPEMPLKKNKTEWYFAVFTGITVCTIISFFLIISFRPTQKNQQS